ncbi:M20/M25/M40 family metallo-hydrolase [Sphingomonas gilva]|uniref:M20/M25/M40 family metallo-hydrolase n=1 Tax=Sphingomonas gilva TaxID=2305907 RepID=A0A396S4Q8_9SPHN|nr:M28 family metallopeptidase [Sphingomonas gilva]RHW18415.1 M20/M25/M40 family metallo-hydrolase [Sphingomonas gilva]
MLRSLTALALVLSAPAVAQTAPAAPAKSVALSPEQAALRAHVAYLASDAMKGREAGTPEYDKAAAYVADQMKALGVQPAGDDGGYLQKVPLVSYKLTDKGSMKMGDTALTFGEDYLPSANPTRAAMTISAPVVFVGYGVVAPELNRDDYAGVDVKGKIVAVMAGAPASMASEIRAHYGSGATKALAAEKNGAVGIVTLETPTLAKVRPFERGAENWDHARMTWAKADGSPDVTAPSVTSAGALSMAGAEKLFAGSGTTYAAVAAAAEAGQPVKPLALKTTLSAASNTAISQVASSNVVGIIPGSDPAIGKQVVVLSAHLDHVGVGKAVDGDTIYNGAMDNAVGIASMLEVARRFKDSGEKPRRSVMLLAVTAEEKGLVGADYFANNPTVPKETLVANVNLDMPIITFAFEDVVAFGADRSTLGPLVRAAAEKMGVGYSPDPMPEQGFFTRSDHYRFVQQGIPAVFLWPGVKGPGKAAFDDFLKNHYHKPSDEVTLPINWQAGVRFVEANYAIAREIANADERPAWNKGDFFGVLYNGYGAK